MGTETQQSRTLGALLYDNAPPAYVPPPVKDIKELSSAKEDYYLKAKDNVNALNETLVNMPYLPQSKGLYDDLRAKSNAVLNTINSENYEDHLLDTKQLASDIKGKFGGTKLVEQAQNLGTALGTLDEAYTKGEIKDPEFRDYKKQQTITSVQGLQINPDGTFSSTAVSPKPFAKYVDRTKMVNDLLTGWKEDGTITTNSDGTIKVNRDIPGYLTTSNSTFTKPEEVYKAARQYMEDNAEVKAYTKDEAEFNTRNNRGSIEELFPKLSSSDKEQITGNKNASIEDVYIAMNSQNLNPRDLLQKKEENRLYSSSADVIANKLGFNKDEVSLHDDTIFNNWLKAKQAKPEEESNASVSFEPFVTQQVLNPTDVIKLESNKNNLVTERTTLQAKTNQYKKALDAQNVKNANLPDDKKEKAYSQDYLENLQKQQSNLDTNIADTVRQQNEVRKITKDVAGKVGIDLDKVYNENYNQSIADVKENNRKALVEIGIFDEENYLNDRGEIRLDKKVELPDGFMGMSIPTKAEYYDMVTKAIATGDSAYATSNANDISHKDFRGQKRALMLPDNIAEQVNKIINAQPEVEYTVGKPITTMLVVGDKLNSNLRAFTNLEKANSISLHTTPEQYSIKDVQGNNIPLKQYVEDMGLDFNNDIDWSKVKSKLAIQTDRDYGQNYGLYLPLTEAAKKSYGTALNKKLGGNTDALKIMAINTTKNVPEEQRRIRATLLTAYQDLTSDSTGAGEDNKKQMGSLYFNNTEDGVDFYKKNLYTLSAGSHADFDLSDAAGNKETYRVTTTAKDADNSDLLNVNFHLGRIKNNQEEVLATDNSLPINDSNRTSWRKLKDVEASPNYSKVTFDTPEDIGANIGYAKMQQDLKSAKPNENVNIYEQYMSTSNFYQTSNTVQDSNYSKIKQETREYYHGTTPIINLENYAKGTNDKIVARVNQDDLIDYAKYYPNNVKKGKDGNQYPYINKEVFPSLSKIIADYDIEITGGFRGETTHSGQAESDPNGLHKYGYAQDISARSDTNEGKKGLKLYNDLRENSSLMKQYGILKAMLHNVNGINHLHLEFNPNN